MSLEARFAPPCGPRERLACSRAADERVQDSAQGISEPRSDRGPSLLLAPCSVRLQ